jgi:membrane fusion protein, multidrug efflux system
MQKQETVTAAVHPATAQQGSTPSSRAAVVPINLEERLPAGDSTNYTPAQPWHTKRRRLLIGTLGVLVLAVAFWFGIPWVRFALSTVSTDDAYVNGYVTFVAARVGGQVSKVLVNDDNRVHKGDVLVELDKEPYQDAVAVRRAAVGSAEADLRVARATVRGIEAQASSRRWTMQHAMEEVGDQISLLNARIAVMNKSKAELALADVDFDRAKQLVVSETIPRAEYDRRHSVFLVAQAQVTQALADVHQIRASLGLPAKREGDTDLGLVPPDLDQTFSLVLQAQSALIQSAAELGVVQSLEQTPKQMLEEFEKSDPDGIIDHAFARMAAQAPAVDQAKAKLEIAKRDLAVAELDLRYCDVVAEIDGVITRRNVNPGNNVQVGQSVMAIRSLNEIWIDANFKETQLRDLRIGQSVDLYVDMYGNRHVFKGRVVGFTMGTGSTLALLPAQNATGNFIKVVQRLPVRIEPQDYDPDQTTAPLFVGTSVVPYIYTYRPPTGPNAGKFLQAYVPESPTDSSTANPQGAKK